MYAERWHRWFAWRPVRLGGVVVWLRTIERRGCEDMGGNWTEYREKISTRRHERGTTGVTMNLEQVARVAHEVNRAYCLALGAWRHQPACLGGRAAMAA